MIRLATDGLVSFSTAPLRLALDLGFVVSGLAFFFGIATLITKLAGAFLVPGWLTIVLVTSFIGGIQLIVIGVVGEYVGRIYDEVKARPLYLVRELHGFEHEPIPGARSRRRSCRSCERRRRARVNALAARLPRVTAVRRRSSRRLTALALIVAAAAYVYTRDLHTYPNFDEGNYLGSLDALRHGQALGRDVFLDQPPGWYLLLVAVSYPFGNSITVCGSGSQSSR